MDVANAVTSLPLLIALMGAVDAFVLGRSTSFSSTPVPREIAALVVELRLALCEPLLSTAALLALLAGSPFTGGQPAVVVTLGALVWIVGLPLRGQPLQDPALRAARATLLRLSLARWATLIAPAAFLPVTWPWLSFVGAALVWRTVTWAKHQLTVVLVPPQPRRRPTEAPLTLTLTPPPPPEPSPLERLLQSAPPGPALACTSCGAETPITESACPSCGLLFASRVPDTLVSLADVGYHVVRPLGAGGMSAVYLAYDRSAHDWCCVKTIVSVDPEGDTVWRGQAAASLAREAHILVELKHPSVSHIRDWLDDPQRPCLVLELVPGASLEQRLGEHRLLPLPVGVVCDWGCTLAELLAHFAELGQPIVHGDIKPGNLLLDAVTSQPILVDFGSAARLEVSSGTVQAHDTYGTPGYAAPEQYRGQIALASDVYGLGATLYHLLTGDDPTTHPLQFTQLDALPTGLHVLLSAMLQTDPEARPSAGEVAMRLAAYTGDETTRT